jgi:hypothetical protein
MPENLELKAGGSHDPKTLIPRSEDEYSKKFDMGVTITGAGG